QALPRIIDYFKKRGYTFTTVADYLGKTKEAMMPSIPKGKGYYLIQANLIFIEAVYWISHVLFSLFIIFIILSIGRVLLMAVLATAEKRKEGKAAALAFPVAAHYPLVSIIVPAYNEEVNAVSSLQNLLKTDYHNYNIIFIDDGSKDATYERVVAAFEDYPKIEIFSKSNGGKASALNFGIAQTEAPFVVCIDADTKLHPAAVSELMKHFLADENEKIGAVAGNVKVGNEVNMLSRWQAIEYISSQNFDRRAFAAVNAVTVVPGAIGAFRKQAIVDAGGFTTDTLAEDCDLTIRILRWLAMPNILLFQYFIPFFIPVADLLMIVGLLTGSGSHILPYYAAFMLFDAGIAIAAFRMEKESLARLAWLIPQRLIYRWLIWWVLFKALRRAMKGEIQSWGILKRTGKVKEVAV
ncbi:MAG: glycosyltransferase, partial [Chitinophagaceae bacterium]